MMKTPIYDFLNKYKSENNIRFHMPGHKGRGPNELKTVSPYDITEISGADFLFDTSNNGIISESEKNASQLFNSALTLYSTEGSTLAIKTMLYLTVRGKKRKILAARNVHKSFINACALIDIDVDWLYTRMALNSVCTINLTSIDLENALSAYKKGELPSAVYITTPDYLGNMLDVKSLSDVCKKYDIPLLVDNAHGAYLNFLSNNLHPLSQGADICCDSAHKTLPCLTGGAYLHISNNAKNEFKNKSAVKEAMQIFATTSPSYLILESLDLCNRLLSDNKYIDRLNKLCKRVKKLKAEIKSIGYDVIDKPDTEPLKLVLLTKELGINGKELLCLLEKHNIFCEYADESAVVLMISTENDENDFNALLYALKDIKKTELNKSTYCFSDKENITIQPAEKRISIRDALFSKIETVPIDKALGRICASSVSICPPCIPLVISGEVFDRNAINLLKRYSIFSVNVVQ